VQVQILLSSTNYRKEGKMQIEHYLRIEDNYLKRLVSGEKKAEIRYNDRDYQVGDVLKFYNTLKNIVPGDSDFYLYFRVTHIHSGSDLKDGYVCLSVEQILAPY
jgi:ASC-1-like (ASCH) protein